MYVLREKFLIEHQSPSRTIYLDLDVLSPSNCLCLSQVDCVRYASMLMDPIIFDSNPVIWFNSTVHTSVWQKGPEKCIAASSKKLLVAPVLLVTRSY